MTYHFLGPEESVPLWLDQLSDDPQFWGLVDLVDQLDMSVFEVDFRADGVGGRPYDPRLMLVSVLWCYQQGVRSPTEMARWCRSHVRLAALWGRRRVPSAATFRRFVYGHQRGWQAVSVEILAACGQADLIEAGITGTDSSPVSASASSHASISVARIRLEASEVQHDLERVRARIIAMGEDLDRGASVDDYIGQVCGDLRRGEARLRNRLARLRHAEAVGVARGPDPGGDVQRLRARVEHHVRDLEVMVPRQQAAVDAYNAKVAAGHKPRGPAPRAPNDHPAIKTKQRLLHKAREKLESAMSGQRKALVRRVNTTDPSSRLLKGKNDTRWVQGDLLTITVSGGQIILAADLHDGGNDQGGLHPSLALTARRCQQAAITAPAWVHLADAGYASAETFTTPPATGGTLYVALKREYADKDIDQPSFPTGQREMAARMATPEGVALYRRRAGIVEPVFAHLFAHGGRNLHVRGAAKHAEIMIMADVYNASKYLRHQQRLKHAAGQKSPVWALT